MMAKKSAAAFLLGAIFLAGCNNKPVPPADNGKGHYSVTKIPDDVDATCTVSSGEFNGWFANGKAAPNGRVLPANSAGFPNSSDCDFYKWSEQMLLWVTSPLSESQPSGGIELQSGTFYTVLPSNQAGNRTLVQNTPGRPITASGSIKNRGVNNLPVIIDKKGRMWEVEVLEEKGNLKNTVTSEGKQQQIARLEDKAGGGHKFYNSAGAEIMKPTAIIQHKKNAGRILQKQIINGKTVYISASEGEVETESSQASGNAFIAQNGSLVYYILFVNDVYAYYLTGANNKQFKNDPKLYDRFPTDSADRTAICEFARSSNNATLADSNALSLELKTSWVVVNDALKDTDSYIKITATVPKYDTVDPRRWVPVANVTQTVRLALVGMHIIGGVRKHPEMIWATYEHESSAPNVAYNYLSKGKIATSPAENTKDWLFHDNTDEKANIPHMDANGDTITGAPVPNDSSKTFKIGKSNTIRTNPWGNYDSLNSKIKCDTAAAIQNTLIASINKSVICLLPGQDIRKKYLLIGASWTAGAAPNGNGYGTSDSVAIGSKQLANTSMETFVQTISQGSFGAAGGGTGGCFNCHNGTLVPSVAFGLSHIYNQIDSISPALPKAPPAIKNSKK